MTNETIQNEVEEYDRSLRAILDPNPLPTTFWKDDEHIIYCNQAALDLFEVPTVEEFIRVFDSLSPEKQPDGSLSKEQVKELNAQTFKEGLSKFEWMHQKLDGTPIPTEITIMRITYQDAPAIVTYTRDLREIKKVLAEMREADDRAQIMLDATPLCCNFWDENMNNIDCNQEAVRLFELKDKQEYLDRFFELSPEYQPDGRLSSEAAPANITKALNDGRVVFEWMHQKLDGTPIPAEITLVRTKQGDRVIVVGYTRDLREEKKILAEMHEADDRAQIMLDATPLCCNFWDANMNNIDCNQEAVRLFELKDKQEYLDRFFELSPEYQPDGVLSMEKAPGFVQQAFTEGRVVFEWMHQKLDGTPIPAEITLVRVKRGESNIVVGYTRDLREEKKMLAEMREADERTQIMLDATPLCCNLWDENMNNIDCNQEAVKLFELKDKQEYLERFNELSPEYQPDGRLSSEAAAKYVNIAFTEGRVVFEWMHQKLNGEPVPAEITLVRVKRGDSFIVAGYTRDMREMKKMLTEMREADERTQIMLDATPLCSNFWDESRHNIDCNQEAVNLFELQSKQEYLERFGELSPEYQPDGQLSAEKAAKYVDIAFSEGRVVFEWMHQKLDGTPIPAEITLVRVKRGESNIVVGYTRDLREEKRMLAEMREADERTQIMLDATPLCCNLWDENMNNIDCNQEAVNLFELKSKQEYLDRFFELSPEYQPDGRLSSEKAAENINKAFTEGRTVFEWMHQKLNGEPVPAEITLVRVKQGDSYIVAGYTRDLRELKKTVERLDQLENLAFTDAGTGVYNRRYFMTRVQRSFALDDPKESPLAIIMMDLDFFKDINDTYGHLAGDEVLKAIASTTQSILRPNDLLARYGGEEFIIMIKQSRPGVAEMLAERIRSAIADLKVTYNGICMSVTVSLGIATRKDSSETVEQVINRADENMYHAKQKGRNRVEDR